jgi:hypothetical protein
MVVERWMINEGNRESSKMLNKDGSWEYGGCASTLISGGRFFVSLFFIVCGIVLS